MVVSHAQAGLVSFAGNPCVNLAHDTAPSLTPIPWHTLSIQQELGSGASGIISQASWQGEQDIAVKVFKGKVTSDGFPQDEKKASIHAGDHAHLVKVLGQVSEHPEQKEGLILTLIPNSYNNLGNPPSLASCTRDMYCENTQFHVHQVFNIIRAVASVAAHLHQKQVKHGDLYAHNILINDAAHCLLGDFGAASIYTNLPSTLHDCVERIEVRALGCLLEDLLELTLQPKTNAEAQLCDTLQDLKALCLQTKTNSAPILRH
ncbi:MAG: protein kinase [Ghiorsea sp.]|nr:protein kinase [Ghiorsea sp.]